MVEVYSKRYPQRNDWECLRSIRKQRQALEFRTSLKQKICWHRSTLTCLPQLWRYVWIKMDGHVLLNPWELSLIFPHFNPSSRMWTFLSSTYLMKSFIWMSDGICISIRRLWGPPRSLHEISWIWNKTWRKWSFYLMDSRCGKAEIEDIQEHAETETKDE